MNQDFAKSSSFGGASASKTQGLSRQGSLLLEIANARAGAKKESQQVTSPTVIAERDAAYREQLENQKRLDDFKKELEKDLIPIENSIRHCRRLFDDYKAEQKEALERRDSEEEGAYRGRLQGTQVALEGDYHTGSRKKMAQARASAHNGSGSGTMKAVAASSAAAPDYQQARGSPGG